MEARALVVIVDDDESIRESLPDLLKELGFAAQAFSSAEDFLASEPATTARCLILDIAMPGMTGPELWSELTKRGSQIPVIFITANRYDTVCPRLLAQGAVACLIKPFSDKELYVALNDALRMS